MDYDLERPGWFRAAEKFADGIAHVSNYPLAYVYANFLALSGHLIGRNAHIKFPGPLYPNHYIVLVGESGIHHKSTAINMSVDTLPTDYLDEHPPIHSVTTSQGLLLAMSNGGGEALVTLDEMASMLSKKRQDFAADLLSRVVELYSCPRSAGTYTRHDPIVVSNAFLTIISASTVEWLQSTLANTDLMAGFGNRMSFILGDPRPDKPWPGTPDLTSVDWEAIRGFDAVCQLDLDARDKWEDWYVKFQRKQKSTSSFIRVLAERIPEKVLKNCVVQCAWRDTDLISPEMLDRAIDWGDYLYECVENIVPAFEHAEAQVLAAIKKGYNTKPKLFGHLSHVFGAERIKNAINALRWYGLITEANGRLTPRQ